jgi:hypothetical protein
MIHALGEQARLESYIWMESYNIYARPTATRDDIIATTLATAPAETPAE